MVRGGKERGREEGRKKRERGKEGRREGKERKRRYDKEGGRQAREGVGIWSIIEYVRECMSM